jgi:protein DJ-1
MTRNIRIVPDHPTIVSVPHQNAHEVFDILILPGGAPGAKTFCSNNDVLELVANFRKAGKWVAAICAGTTALVASQRKYGGKKARVTSHPSVQREIEGERWEYSEERVVVDGRVVTSRG